MPPLSRTKLCIIKASEESLLNKRTELVSKCRDKNRFYLRNFPHKAITFYVRILIELEQGLNECRFNKTRIYFRVNEFEIGVDESIFCGNEQEKVHRKTVIEILAK